jgi:hypothetical protein
VVLPDLAIASRHLANAIIFCCLSASTWKIWEKNGFCQRPQIYGFIQDSEVSQSPFISSTPTATMLCSPPANALPSPIPRTPVPKGFAFSFSPEVPIATPVTDSHKSALSSGLLSKLKGALGFGTGAEESVATNAALAKQLPDSPAMTSAKKAVAARNEATAEFNMKTAYDQADATISLGNGTLTLVAKDTGGASQVPFSVREQNEQACLYNA